MKTENTNKLVNADGKNLATLLKSLIDDEIIYNADGIKIGKVEGVDIIERTNAKDKTKFKKIDVSVRDSENKKFVKSYSTDFAGKYFRQLGIKAADMANAVVVFKVKEYKNIGYLAFVVETPDGLVVRSYEEQPEIDSGLDALLGLK